MAQQKQRKAQPGKRAQMETPQPGRRGRKAEQIRQRQDGNRNEKGQDRRQQAPR